MTADCRRDSAVSLNCDSAVGRSKDKVTVIAEEDKIKGWL